jgi:Flp pilus assembly protein TadG
MVTAELAVALPALVLVVGAAFGGIAAMTAQLRCADAAAVGARLAARGESDSVVLAGAARAEPGGQVTVARAATTVEVEVSRRLIGPGILDRLGLTVTETAVAPLEPTG